MPIVVIYSIITILSIAGGWLAKHLVHRGWGSSKARRCCMLLFALSALPILLVKNVGLWEAVGILFMICGCAYIVAFMLNHLLAPRFEQVNLEKTASENPSAWDCSSSL